MSDDIEDDTDEGDAVDDINYTREEAGIDPAIIPDERGLDASVIVETANADDAPLSPEADAALAAKREHLLASIEDLDAEFAAGDLSAEDHSRLRDTYIARAGGVMDQLELHHYGVPELARKRTPLQLALIFIGIAGVAVLAGVLLAHSLGSRTNGATLTGGGESAADRQATCLGTKDAGESAACFDAILADTPENPDALTYKGWALYRSGEKAAGEKLFAQVVATSPDYPDVRAFRAIAAKDRGDFVAASSELDTLWTLKPSQQILDTVTAQQLDATVDYNLMPTAVRACWDQALDVGQQLVSSPTSMVPGVVPAGVNEAIGCFDTILATAPADRDALVTKAATILGLVQTGKYVDAAQAMDTVLATNPTDYTALLVRAAAMHSLGRDDRAKTDLDAIGTHRTSSQFGFDIKQLRAIVDQGTGG